MALLFQSAVDNANWWVTELKRRLPNLDLRVWPECGDPADIDYALVWKPPLGLLADLPNLKAILSLGAGVDHIFVDPELPVDVPVARVIDDRLTAGIVEYGLATILAAHRRFPEYAQNRNKGEWRILSQRTAEETRVGILGLGVLGTSLAQACVGLGFQVAGWSRTSRRDPLPGGLVHHHGNDGLENLLAKSNILVCLLPLTQETEDILNRDNFAQLPKGAWVINIARGAHIVDDDLLAALDSGHLSGAYLDVFTVEPLPQNHPFWRHEKIILTPHIAAVTDPRSVADQVVENIRRVENGEVMHNLVDLTRGY